MSDIVSVLLVAAVAINGVVVGASLDQSIKQLPARRRIGAVAYSAYSRAADLGHGIAWYGSVGIGALLITLAAAIVAYAQANSSSFAPFMYLAGALSVVHSLVTTQAAPLMFSQRRHEGDEAALTTVFNRFERWQTLRVLVQVLAFAALLWALVLHG